MKATIKLMEEEDMLWVKILHEKKGCGDNVVPNIKNNVVC